MNIYWAQIVFTVLAALAAGVLEIMAGAALAGTGGKSQRPGAAIAVVSLLLSGAAGLLYLGHPERIFAAFTNFRSPLTQGAAATAVSGALAAFYLVQLSKKAAVGKGFLWLLTLLPLAMMIVLSRYYYMPGRPWRLFVMYFSACVVLAVLLGSATVSAVAWLVKDAPGLRWICALCAVVSLIVSLSVMRNTYQAMNPLVNTGSGYGETPVFLAPSGGPGSNCQSAPDDNGSYGETPSFLKEQ